LPCFRVASKGEHSPWRRRFPSSTSGAQCRGAENTLCNSAWAALASANSTPLRVPPRGLPPAPPARQPKAAMRRGQCSRIGALPAPSGAALRAKAPPVWLSRSARFWQLDATPHHWWPDGPLPSLLKMLDDSRPPRWRPHIPLPMALRRSLGRRAPWSERRAPPRKRSPGFAAGRRARHSGRVLHPDHPAPPPTAPYSKSCTVGVAGERQRCSVTQPRVGGPAPTLGKRPRHTNPNGGCGQPWASGRPQPRWGWHL